MGSLPRKYRPLSCRKIGVHQSYMHYLPLDRGMNHVTPIDIILGLPDLVAKQGAFRRIINDELSR
jgi:hypothetical protein